MTLSPSDAQRWPLLDLHCHYLPGVDDGARSLDEGVALVHAAVANGIQRIVLTPHVHPGRYANTLTNLRPRFENFRRIVGAAQLPVQLALGCEARLCDELLPLIERDEVPLLVAADNTRTLLLELPHSCLPAGSVVFIRWLQRNGITPLLAHPERNKELMKHPQRLQQIRDAGCLVQITAAAVIGGFGEQARAAASNFLEKDWVDIVASDAHNLRHRPPLMREAALAIAQRFGEERARRLTVTTPAALTQGSFKSADINPKPADPNRGAAAKPQRETEPKPQRKIETMTSQATAPSLRENDDVCNEAFSRMRAELLRRACEPTSNGAKAARILQLMNSLQAR